MTDQELKDLVASFAIDRKEMERERKEAERKAEERRIEAERSTKELKAGLRDLEERVNFTTKNIDKLCEQMGGINENIGSHAEQFFQNVFERKLEFASIKFDEMVPNLAYKGKTVKIEFDIALVNGSSVALIEVKNRIHPNFVKKFAEERMTAFRKYFHEFDECKAYLGIAAFSFSEEALGEAKRYGIGIVRQAGDSVEVDSGELRAY